LQESYLSRSFRSCRGDQGSPMTETDKKIKDYEKEGKWSHAAELADKEAEKTKRDDLKTRALENYKKAGYNFDKYDT
jgi:flagellar hook-length control protein FliK